MINNFKKTIKTYCVTINYLIGIKEKYIKSFSYYQI